MRLFVALDLPDSVRAALRELIAGLRRAEPGAHWVRTEGMHLTLKFIGEQPAEKQAAIQQALAGVARTGPVTLRVAGLGYFPSERRPRVFWAGVEASENLAALATNIEAALEPLGIARERRAYLPHLTLARFPSPAPAPHLQAAVAALGATDCGSFEAAEFYLYQSKLSPRGAEYAKLASFSLVRS